MILVFRPGHTDPIVVTVLAIRRHHVKIGIDAPPEIAIWREEAAPAALAERN